MRILYPDIFSLISGSHVSLNPDTVPLNNFDILCFGAGKRAILELVTQLDQKGSFPVSQTYGSSMAIRLSGILPSPFYRTFQTVFCNCGEVGDHDGYFRYNFDPHI
ncbi:MAG: hypothetical protein A2W25_12595 [candidate division Zixibacteria bacterium RBG_16_53_22]|nr:MAG: hypothetical protein A2W25_12595 [candidate division Zixibacteria bacterium RBG_16_53_22]